MSLNGSVASDCLACRLSLAYLPAEEYINSFSSESIVVVARCAA
jgi:hypothetical protein